MKTQYPVQEWWLLYNSMFKYHPLLPLLPLPFSSSLSFSGIARYLSLWGTYKQQTTISSCSLERLDHLRKTNVTQDEFQHKDKCIYANFKFNKKCSVLILSFFLDKDAQKDHYQMTFTHLNIFAVNPFPLTCMHGVYLCWHLIITLSLLFSNSY